MADQVADSDWECGVCGEDYGHDVERYHPDDEGNTYCAECELTSKEWHRAQAKWLTGVRNLFRMA